MRYTSGTTATKYTYTGQYSNIGDIGLMFYNARWYDPALGRFAQADSIVPDGVQGYDRYAYANNSPVVYADPTGHCVNGDIECRDELRETESKYHVSIDDKGGNWTVRGLSSIASGMGALRKSMGVDGFEHLFAGVKFSTYSVPGPGGCKLANDMCAHGNNVRVDVSLMGRTDDYVETNTVHEFGHVWDNTCNGCMSKGMMRATGGSESTEYRLLGKLMYASKNVYRPGGDPPTRYATTNRGEDWAESLSAFLYDETRLDGPRSDYIAAFLPFHIQ